MYSTKTSTGRHKSYNQTVGYAAPDYHKDSTDAFGKLELSEDEQGRTYFLDEKGIKRDVTVGGGAILKQHILNRAETSLPAYRYSSSYNDHQNQAMWELKNGVNPELSKLYEEKGYQAISDRADELAKQNLVSFNLDQVKSKNKNIIKDDLYSESDRAARGVLPPDVNLPGPDSSLVTQEYKPIDISDLTYIGSVDVDLTKEGIRGLRSAPAQKTPTTFEQVPSKYRETFEKMYKLYKGETAYNNIKEGKSTLTKDELNQFTLLYNSLHQGLRTNTSTAPIGTKPAEISAKHGDLFGVPEEAVKADVLTKGPAGYSPNTKIYDAVEGEWTTFDKINRTDDKDKQLTYRVNKRFTTQNPLYLLSGNDKRYVKGYSLISSDGKYQFIIPEKENKISEIDELQAQLGSAIYSEGTPVKIDKLSTNGNNVFSLYKDGLFTLMTIDPQTGVPEYYTDKEGKTIATQSATDMQKWITQNTPKK
jgi:hypothetical protein